MAAALALPLGACSFFEFPPQTRGNMVDADQLKELVVGTSTKSDAQSLLGSPTTRATFDDNTWIYIGEVTRPVIARTQAVDKQDVTVLTFDQGGVLRNVRRLDRKNALPVQTVDRTTPSPGTEASFLQMLLGNVGKFSPTPTGGSGAGTSNGFSVGH
jgi:outer membrane protein assembly factor BamE (lipoprotein component of BamABCDE complex)